MVLHVHFESLYISLPSSAKQREITKSSVFWWPEIFVWVLWLFFGWIMTELNSGEPGHESVCPETPRPKTRV